MMRYSLITLLSLLWITGAAGAAVLTVGPGGDYADIQAAVNAAVEGDTILVSPGTYGPVEIIAKGLSLAADGAGVVVDGSLVVEDLPETSTVVVVGLDLMISNPLYDGTNTIHLLHNKGPVRIEDCTSAGHDGFWLFNPFSGQYDLYPATHGAYVGGCWDAAFVRCTLEGGNGWGGDFTINPDNGECGLFADATDVVLYDCIMEGGIGGAEPNYFSGATGGNGFETQGICSLFASGCTFQGGNGGFGKYLGGWGGDGIHTDADAEIWLLDCTCLGGDGGLGTSPGDPGDPIDGGPVNQMTGTARTMEMPSPVRVNEQISLTLTGEPHDRAALFICLFTDSQFMPFWGGQLLIDMDHTPALMIMGSLPASGTVTWPLIIPEQDPAFTDLTGFVQPVFADTSGRLFLGSLRSLIVVDDTY